MTVQVVLRSIAYALVQIAVTPLYALIARLTELRGDLSDGSTIDRVFRQAALRRAELLREQD
jgi:hypothetical protein